MRSMASGCCPRRRAAAQDVLEAHARTIRSLFSSRTSADACCLDVRDGRRHRRARTPRRRFPRHRAVRISAARRSLMAATRTSVVTAVVARRVCRVKRASAQVARCSRAIPTPVSSGADAHEGHEGIGGRGAAGAEAERRPDLERQGEDERDVIDGLAGRPSCPMVRPVAATRRRRCPRFPGRVGERPALSLPAGSWSVAAILAPTVRTTVLRSALSHVARTGPVLRRTLARPRSRRHRGNVLIVAPLMLAWSRREAIAPGVRRHRPGNRGHRRGLVAATGLTIGSWVGGQAVNHVRAHPRPAVPDLGDAPLRRPRRHGRQCLRGPHGHFGALLTGCGIAREPGQPGRCPLDPADSPGDDRGSRRWFLSLPISERRAAEIRLRDAVESVGEGFAPLRCRRPSRTVPTARISGCTRRTRT